MKVFTRWLVATVIGSLYPIVLAAAQEEAFNEAAANARRRLLRGLQGNSDNSNGNNNNNGNNNKIAKADCTIQIAALLQIPDEPTMEEDEVFDCMLDPEDTPGHSGLIRNIAMSANQKADMKNMWKEGKIRPGQSKLKLKGKGIEFDDKEVKLNPSYDVRNNINRDGKPPKGNGNDNGNNAGDNSSEGLFGENKANGLFLEFKDNNNNRRLEDHTRRLASVTGDKPILVVKVTDASNPPLARSESPAVIGDDIFGYHGDTVNLKSQLSDCSMGKLNIVPGVPEHMDKYAIVDGEIQEGVIEITIGITLPGNDRYAIHNAVTAKVSEYLGTSLPGPYDQVMYVIEKCYVGCGWAAYA